MSFGSNPDKIDLIFKDKTKIPSAEKYLVFGVTIYNRLTFYNDLKTVTRFEPNLAEWLSDRL